MTLAEITTRLAALEEAIASGVSYVMVGDRQVAYSRKDMNTERDRLLRDLARAQGRPSRTVSRFNLTWTP